MYHRDMEGLFTLLDTALISRAAAATCMQIHERKLYRAAAGYKVLSVHEEVTVRRFRKAIQYFLDNGTLPGKAIDRRIQKRVNSHKVARLNIFKDT